MKHLINCFFQETSSVLGSWRGTLRPERWFWVVSRCPHVRFFPIIFANVGPQMRIGDLDAPYSTGHLRIAKAQTSPNKVSPSYLAQLYIKQTYKKTHSDSKCFVRTKAQRVNRRIRNSGAVTPKLSRTMHPTPNKKIQPGPAFPVSYDHLQVSRLAK